MAETRGYRLNTPIVAHQEVEGEGLLIHFDSGCYFSANRTGSVLFDLAQSGATVSRLTEALAERCGVAATEIRESVESFLGAAEAEGLVVPWDGADGVVAMSANGARLEYEAPRFERFDDLQDLLMLDPIHDVDQVGWPMQHPTVDAPSDERKD